MGSRTKDSFLVTLWIATGEGAPAAVSAWRGSVEHLATKRRLYFSDPNELIGFLRGHLASAREGRSRE